MILPPMVRWLSCLVIALVAVGGATTAYADEPGAAITYVEPTSDGLQVLMSVPARTRVDLEQVQVTVDGVDSPASAEPASGTTTVARTAVLVIDTSNSMRGARFRAAREAARAYLAGVPGDVEVGLVTFSNEVSQEVAPTRDRSAVTRAVNQLTLSRQTRLHDGVLAAIEAAGREGQRSLLVLSDGADTSDTPLEEVTAAIDEAEVQVDTVSLDQGAGRAQRALASLAAAGDGRVVDAGSDDLAAAFSVEADVLARQVLVTTEVPAAVTAREATVAVTLGSSRGELSAESFVPVGKVRAASPSAPRVVAPETWLVLPGWMPWAAAGLVAAGLLIVLLVMAFSAPPAGPSMTDRIQQYTRRRTTEQGRADIDPLGQARGAAQQVLDEHGTLQDRISTSLEAAGSAFKPAEWLLLHAGIAVGSFLLGVLLGGGSIPLGLLFLAFGVVGPRLYLGFKKSRRKKAFNAALPDTLQLMSGSLSAGMSLAQSVDTITREASDPMAGEFKRVLVETRLGVPLEDALEGIAERFDSEDFGWVVMAIRIQRQVGGNLAELLDTVAGTIREREYLRRQVLALSAEGRLSAWVLGGLPPLFFVYLVFTQGDYVRPLYTTLAGWIILAGAGVLLAIGAFWMSRLVKVEI